MKPLNPTPPTEYHGLMRCGKALTYVQCYDYSVLAAALKLNNQATRQGCRLKSVYEVGE